MKEKIVKYLKTYYKLQIAFAITFLPIRIFEYFQVGDKSLSKVSFINESIGLFYDFWALCIYCFILLVPFLLFALVHKKFAQWTVHFINIFSLSAYISLIIVFKERNTPFDHELFNRSFQEIWATTLQMASTGIVVFLPFVFYVGVYFFIYFKKIIQLSISKAFIFILIIISFTATIFANKSLPNQESYENRIDYYLTVNKIAYWINDVYYFYKNMYQFDPSKFTKEELATAIDTYQQNQGFSFNDGNFPLLHTFDSTDVLGPYFNLKKETPPNIVFIVVEGLSRDFSGPNAYATSFTPFLDSLANKSLYWYNFLSTAPGTFASQPAINASVPYGKKGFSLINVMPNHLSLISLLKHNGYHTKFLIGFNPDFDNMGGFIRRQGTDFILLKYPAKYKEMGIGAEGWSMGYPDDALYERSFTIMDSLPQKPYFHIYHTGTTHMPYLFDQQKAYEKKFDDKLPTLPVSKEIKNILKETKNVMTTFMFSDDCLRQFFKTYQKRKEFQNTIFLITGDHHIGSFPSTSGIDDYYVPLIIYSPLLKSPKRFYSVSTHNSITPSIAGLLFNNYPSLHHKPKSVPWLTGALDTAGHFRNMHSMPFMLWSREITDYIYKDYYLSGNILYKMESGMKIHMIKNDSLKKKIISLRDNFKLINNYVTDNDLVYPEKESNALETKTLLYEYKNPKQIDYNFNSADTTILPALKLDNTFKNLYVEFNAEVKIDDKKYEDQPAIRLAIIDTTKGNRNFLFWTNHNIVQLSKNDFDIETWNPISMNDYFNLDEYRKFKNKLFDFSMYASTLPAHVHFKNYNVRIYGIK